MKRQIAYLVVIVVLVIGFFILLFRYIGPVISSNIVPTQTSIYAGNVDFRLIHQLRATQPDGEISREQAIGLAELYCAQVNNSLNQESPSNIKADHLTEGQAIRRLNNGQSSPSSIPVWFVSMNGLWEHVGGPAQPGTNTPPLLFRHCNVIINAQTADLIAATN